MPKEILIEGYTPDQILMIPDEQLEKLLVLGQPIVFRAGTAQILGEFRASGDGLEVVLAQIEGGGEGVLPTLWLLAERYAARRKLLYVDWIVHALNCAMPNPKLRRVLERRGFTIQKVRGDVEAFYYRYEL